MENQALILDLVSWVDARPRPYHEVMAAWRTSCPRLTIWEDSLDLGFLQVVEGTVRTTPAGRHFVRAQGVLSHASGDC